MTTNSTQISILIADDHGIMRQGLELIISRSPSMRIVGQAQTGLQAVDLARRIKPDIILMDITMPELNGIDATKQIIEECPGTKIIALSARREKGFVKNMLHAGASGYILKDGFSDELVTAINMVYQGQVYLSSAVKIIVIDSYVSDLKNETVSGPLDSLTTKERQVLQLIVENKTTAQAAKLLHLSAKTIEARRLKMMKKLGTSSVVDLTKLAIREGLTSLDY